MVLLSELIILMDIGKIPLIFFLLIVFVSGFITGGFFTISCEILERVKIKNTKIAAIIDSLDHFGGLSSTLFVGLLSINIFGIEKTVTLLLIMSIVFLTFSFLIAFKNEIFKR